MALYDTNDAPAGRRRRVLLTGATGYIAGQLLPAFRERYDLRLIDVRETDASGNGRTGTYRAGLTYGSTGAISGDVDTAVTNPGTSGIAYTNATTAGPSGTSIAGSLQEPATARAPTVTTARARPTRPSRSP